ncbi:phosphodiester glycosidase family protein [Clostridium hydrogenum]|uniref:phosphodiester glycosidase family protein n=1 Tax=Clostridium hydrogenum TaxID=2855764 RepID=UPI001F3922C1|nr:phosphodiester glycosidase family protein [Clostridium hydrogenum]
MDSGGKLQNKKRKSKVKEIIAIILFEVVFTAVTVIPFTLYGPFKGVRNMIISTLMGTGAHQYMAKWFFSDAQIAEIIKEESKAEDTSDNTKIEKVKVQYNDDGIGYTTTKTDKYDEHVLVIRNPRRVKIGYAAQIGYVGDTTHGIAKKYKAIAAVNGGYYEDTLGNGTGAIPTGFVICNGKIVYPKKEDNWDEKMGHVMSIDANGNFSVGGSYSANELVKNNVNEALVTGPYIIKDGINKVEEGVGMAASGFNPRTVIGQAADKSIVLLTIDGRQGIKIGASLHDVQRIMRSFNVVNAVCLDGGGSTAMYYNGEIVNNPSNATGERAVPDIVYVEQ